VMRYLKKKKLFFKKKNFEDTYKTEEERRNGTKPAIYRLSQKDEFIKLTNMVIKVKNSRVTEEDSTAIHYEKQPAPLKTLVFSNYIKTSTDRSDHLESARKSKEFLHQQPGKRSSKGFTFSRPSMVNLKMHNGSLSPRDATSRSNFLSSKKELKGSVKLFAVHGMSLKSDVLSKGSRELKGNKASMSTKEFSRTRCSSSRVGGARIFFNHPALDNLGITSNTLLEIKSADIKVRPITSLQRKPQHILNQRIASKSIQNDFM
jgi:hypothetical protein